MGDKDMFHFDKRQILSGKHPLFQMLMALLLVCLILASCGAPSPDGEGTTETRARDSESEQTPNQTEMDSETESETDPVKDYPASILCSFDGHVDNDIRGCIAGTVTVDKIPEDLSCRYLLIYFADDQGILEGYDELLSIPYSGTSSVSGVIKDGTYLPGCVTRLVAVPSATAFLGKIPADDSVIGSYRFPDSKKLLLDEQPLFTFGAVSDVHMNYESYSRGAYHKWADALAFYAENKMDAVVVGGDLTGDEDLKQDYEKYLDIVYDSPFDPSMIFECIGNHGNTKSAVALFLDAIRTGKEIFPFEGSPYYHIELGHQIFIFMAQEINGPSDSAAYDNFSKQQIDWLEGLLKEYYGPENNIFILEHSPFLNFGPGDRMNGDYSACVAFNSSYTNTMRLQKLLSTYRDVIFMSGHTHLTLYDNENYSSLNGAFARMLHLPSSCQPCGYGQGKVYTKSYDGRLNVTPDYGSETYLCYVYKDYIVFVGYNLSTGKIIPCASYILETHPDYTGIDPYQGDTSGEATLQFSGSGTSEDPYLIENSRDFFNLTALFNKSTDQNQMYGKDLYFLQTADIDMTGYQDYDGTFANGNSKCYFAGNYDGDGHMLTVDIDSSAQKSVFPYTYGTIQNLYIKGLIKTSTSAQPFRTNYGTIQNVIIEMELESSLTHGICYSNYGTVSNVVTLTKLAGSTQMAVTSNGASGKFSNVFYNCNSSSGAYGTKLTNLENAVSKLNEYADANGLWAFEIADGKIVFDN